MKKTVLKISLVVVLFMVYAATLFANEKNGPQGSTNAFAKNYGQVIPSSVKGAQDALLFIDFEVQDGKIPEALVSLGYTVKVATDWYDFSSKLNSGSYGLAVGFNQNDPWGSWKPGLLSALTNYIAGGGAVVFNDWQSDNDFAILFQASFMGNENQTIMNLDPSIETNLPNPITLVKHSWTVFSTGLTTTGGAEVLATFANGDAAIVRGNVGKTIILGYLTDTPPAANRQQLFENLFEAVAPSVPLTNWALGFGLLLMLTFHCYTR